MRRRHFAAFAPHCPHCAGAAAGRHTLVLADIRAEQDEDILAGILHCPSCQFEYPIIDGIPLILPGLRALLAERGIELMLREDLDPALESLLGDAIGPGSWFEVLRQTLSTYAWDGWADLDPAEAAADDPVPGAVRRCLARLLDLAGPGAARLRARSRLRRRAHAPSTWRRGRPTRWCSGSTSTWRCCGWRRGRCAAAMSYPRRRDRPGPRPARVRGRSAGRRRASISGPATRSPCRSRPASPTSSPPSTCSTAWPSRRALLAGMAAALAPGGRLLLATPYDWSTRATPVETWIGGHSQRGPQRGAAEPFLHALLTEGAHPQSVPGLRRAGRGRGVPLADPAARPRRGALPQSPAGAAAEPLGQNTTSPGAIAPNSASTSRSPPSRSRSAAAASRR